MPLTLPYGNCTENCQEVRRNYRDIDNAIIKRIPKSL